MIKDAYTWQVTYVDGTCTHEFDESKPDGRGWAEREAKDVATITLARDGMQTHSVAVPEGAEPMFFRRRSLTFGLTDGSTQQGNAIHCIGWKREQEAVYLFVFNDSSTLLTTDLQAV